MMHIQKVHVLPTLHRPRPFCMQLIADSLLETTDDQSKARLRPDASKESGVGLHAHPSSSSCGVRMDDATICVAATLRLGTSLCHCGTNVDGLAKYLYICRWSEG